MKKLSPQQYANNLHNICTHSPTWVHGALGPFAAWQCITPFLHQPLPAPHTHLGNMATLQMAHFTWQEFPLHGRLLKLLAANIKDPIYADLANYCQIPAQNTANEHILQDIALLQNMNSTHNPAILTQSQKYVNHEQYGGFWLEQALAWCLTHDTEGQNIKDLLRIFAKNAPASIKPYTQELCLRYTAAWSLLFQKPHEAHAALCPDFSPDLSHFSHWQNMRKAWCLENMGEHEEALRLMAEVWQNNPWHPNIVLCLHHMLFAPKISNPAPLPPIALYSWNKAEVLEQSLLSLCQTEAAQAKVYVLNNGSSDNTASMLKKLAKQWPNKAGGQLHTIELPVNIGAPAARNWLLKQEEICCTGQMVFLDDDVLLPKGWLHGLQNAAKAYPKAAVVGAAIEGHMAPHPVQCADFLLQPKGMGQRSFADFDERIFLCGSGMGMAEHLLTRYTRPCLSVSGCCHLLRFSENTYPTFFDVRFNPSQFDDVERDMRLQLMQNQTFTDIVYAGGVRIKHVQHSSLKQAKSRAATAHIFGNKIKLEHLFTEQNIDFLRQKTQQKAQQDLLKKITQIASHLAAC